jgi:hypothetical protein
MNVLYHYLIVVFTELTLLGIETRAFTITTESGRDDKQLRRPVFKIVDAIGNPIVILKTESSIFLTDWKGDKVENATSILPASMSKQLECKFEYMVVNMFVPSGFYMVNYCFLGKCLKADLEFFVKNTLLYDDTFAEAIFALTVCMSLVVFCLLPWSFHSDKPDHMSKRKNIVFFLCVVTNTVLHTQVASLLGATSLNKKYLKEFDFVVTAYSVIIPITICFCALQAFLSFYDASFNS